MKKNKWRPYYDLAWTESIITSPDDYREQTESFAKIIKENSSIEVRTLLHLGCGAGIYDHTFKQHFKMTGIDLSENMLEVAAKLNPEITYLCGDMRNINLKERFDAVTIPDSIGHMTTVGDLRKAILTASRYLKPGGVLLIVAHISEEFRENNFVYTGAKGDVEITIFENNYIVKPARMTYEATVVYLIRRKGELEIQSDSCPIGLFPLATWLSLFEAAGLEVNQMKLEHSYDRYILGEGKYLLRMFICSKPL